MLDVEGKLCPCEFDSSTLIDSSFFRFGTENDIILEMLEVFINSILYLRGVYPTSVFRRRKMYSTAVFVSIYQKLNDYITSVLTAAHQLKKLGKLMQLELIIYKKNSRNCFMPLEKYLFDVDLKASLTNSGPTSELSSTSHSDRYLIEFENIVRDALIRLDQMSKNLKTIDCADDEDCCFKIEIQTTESGFVELTNKTNATNEVCF